MQTDSTADKNLYARESLIRFVPVKVKQKETVKFFCMSCLCADGNNQIFQVYLC